MSPKKDCKGSYLKIVDSISINNNDTIGWNTFGIELQLTEILAQRTTDFTAHNYAQAATYVGKPVLEKKIIDVIIKSNTIYNNNSGKDNLTELFDCYYNNRKSTQLSIVDAFNKEIVVVSYGGGSYCGFNSNFLALKKAPNTIFTGKFFIELKFEDGTILQDSTQTITITP
jgi:hypothetical protein